MQKKTPFQATDSDDDDDDDCTMGPYADSGGGMGLEADADVVPPVR
jgi:hypothetical protein